MLLDVILYGLLFLSLGALALHLTSLAIVAVRLRERPRRLSVADPRPSVTLIRPVCGLENNIEATLASTFRLTYPRVEIIFCSAEADDPVVPIVRDLIAAHPEAEAELLIGDDHVTLNPKLNNCLKAWEAATGDWVIISDSNVLLEPDYIDQSLARRAADTDMITAPAIAVAPENFAAEIECAFVNTLQTRWVLAGDSVGLGFALGKSMMWNRETLARLGGVRALGQEVAEDIAATKLMHANRAQVRVTQRPVTQPLGARSFAEVWKRQLRWARLRRKGILPVYFIELLPGSLLPLGAMIGLGIAGFIPAWVSVAYVLAWYGAEMGLSAIAGWPLSLRTGLALVLRDLLLPVVWLAGWLGNDFEWRGNAMTVGGAGTRRRRKRVSVKDATA